MFFCLVSQSEAQSLSNPNSSFRLKVDLNITGQTQEVKSWTLDDLLHFKKASSHEKDPTTGKILKWNGILLSALVEKGMEELLLEKRAQVDLVILKSRSGGQALLPRAFVSKYPILLAFQEKLEEINQRGFLFSVVPWSSKPRILEEDLPIESYFVPAVEKIEFTSYRDQYSPLFLKRRTDPSAMRGEKLFVQNCASCHHLSSSPSISVLSQEKTLDKGIDLKRSLGKHPPMKVSLKFKKKDWDSINRYLDAHRHENVVSVSKVFSN